MNLKTLRRTFLLSIDVPLYAPLVQDVIDTIENDELKVFRPDDEDALKTVFNRKGEILLNARATLPVSIREWLPVGCQLIRVHDGGRMPVGCPEDTLAYYQHNAPGCIFPGQIGAIAGPAAFFGWIIVLAKSLPQDDSPRSREAFQCIIAHELVHVFDIMRIVVPAVMDWRTFRRKALCEGCHDDMAASHYDDNARFIDPFQFSPALLQWQRRQIAAVEI